MQQRSVTMQQHRAQVQASQYSTSELFPAPMKRHMSHEQWLCHAGPLPAAEHCTNQADGQQGKQVGGAEGGTEGDATASSGVLKRIINSQGRDLV